MLNLINGDDSIVGKFANYIEDNIELITEPLLIFFHWHNKLLEICYNKRYEYILINYKF